MQVTEVGDVVHDFLGNPGWIVLRMGRTLRCGVKLTEGGRDVFRGGRLLCRWKNGRQLLSAAMAWVFFGGMIYSDAVTRWIVGIQRENSVQVGSGTI